MSAARTTVSMPAELYARAVERQRELGYATFSDYVQALMRADGLSSGGHVRETAPPGPTAYNKPAPAPSSGLKPAHQEAVDIVKRGISSKSKTQGSPRK